MKVYLAIEAEDAPFVTELVETFKAIPPDKRANVLAFAKGAAYMAQIAPELAQTQLQAPQEAKEQSA